MSEDRRETSSGNADLESAGADAANLHMQSPNGLVPHSLGDNDDEIGLLDLLVVVVENFWLLIIGPLLVGLVALGYAFTITPTFTARTSILPPQQEGSASAAILAQLGAVGGLTATASGIRNPVDRYVALLKSVTIADGLVEQFSLMQLYDVEYRQDARKSLAGNTMILAGKDGLIVIEVDDVSPNRAADIANAYVSEFQALLARLALTEAQQRRLFFEKQMKQTQARLSEAERALAEVGVTTNTLKANPETAISAVARLQAQVTAQKVKLAAMRGYLTDSAPAFVQAQNELVALRSQLRLQQLNEPSVPEKSGYVDRYRSFKYQETLFELFSRQYELAKLDEAREGAIIQVVDMALPPERKSHPKKGLMAILATFATGFVLMLFLLVRRALRRANQERGNAAKFSAIRANVGRLLQPWARD